MNHIIPYDITYIKHYTLRKKKKKREKATINLLDFYPVGAYFL